MGILLLLLIFLLIIFLLLVLLLLLLLPTSCPLPYHGVYLSPNSDSPHTPNSVSPARANGSK